MRHAAVHEVDLLDAGADRVFAADDLGQHPAGDRPVRNQLLDGVEVQRREERRGVVLVLEQARNVRDERELARLYLLRERGGGQVGVDVVEVAVALAGREGGDDGDYPAVEHFVDRAGIDLDHLADVPPVGGGYLSCREDPVAVQRLRVGAALDEATHEVRVHDVVERAPHDLHRLFVRHALALDELRLVAGGPYSGGDGLAAAVYDDDLHADGPHERDVVHERVEVLGHFHDRAADLDEHHRPPEVEDVRQRLGQDGRFRRCCVYLFHREQQIIPKIVRRLNPPARHAQIARLPKFAVFGIIRNRLKQERMPVT